MPNSRNRTTREVPSRTSIVIMGVITLASAVATWWIVNPPEAPGTLDGRHLTGFILGVLATVMLVSQTMDRLTRRVLASIEAKLEQYETEALLRETQEEGQDG